MERQKDYIVFLCYGNERVFHECVFALLSLSRIYRVEELNNMEIWVYTDDPGWFGSFRDCPLPLNYRKLDNAAIKKWRGSINFSHRVKIEALKDFAAINTGNILYADTDTVFTDRIDIMLQDINDGRLYMHTLEGIISDGGNPVLRKLNKHLRKNEETICGKRVYEMAMWNAGVLGFNTRHAHCLEDILNYTDRIYRRFPKHIAEQLAFSVFFQCGNVVMPAAPYIFHYWQLKEAHYVLSSFFSRFGDKSWEELVRLSVLVHMQTLMQEKAGFFQTRNMAASFLNKQWKPQKPNWEILLSQV